MPVIMFIAQLTSTMPSIGAGSSVPGPWTLTGCTQHIVSSSVPLKAEKSASQKLDTKETMTDTHASKQAFPRNGMAPRSAAVVQVDSQ